MPNPLRSCNECRRRRKKCDGARPTCGRCARLSKNCVYEIKEPPQLIDRLQRNIHRLEREVLSLSAANQQQTSPRVLPQRFHTLFNAVTQIASSPVGFLPGPEAVVPFYREPVNSADAVQGVTLQYLETGYSTTISRDVLKEHLSRWKQHTEPEHELQSLLIAVFIPFRAHFNFYFDIPTFLRATRYPSSHPRGIHPSLLNAIYLVACNLAFGSQNPYDSLFLARARKHLDNALSMADRLTHFMWGSLVLCTYFARVGRALESHSLSATTVSFAVGWGLPGRAEPQTGRYLDPQERHLWEALCNMEFAHTYTFDLPCSVPEKLLNEMRVRYLGNASHGASVAGNKDIVYLTSKISFMLYLVVWLRDQFDDVIRSNQAPHPSLSHELHNLGNRLQLFQQSLPPIDAPNDLLAGEVASQVNHLLIRSHFGACFAIIQLWNILASQDDAAYAKVVEAALRMAHLTRPIRKNHSGARLIHVPLNMISHLYTASEVLIRECHRPRWFPRQASAPGSPCAPSVFSPSSLSTSLPDQPDQRVSEGLDWLFDFQLDMLRYYPILARSMGKLKDLINGSEDYDII